MASSKGVGETLLVFDPAHIDRGLVSEEFADTYRRNDASLGTPLQSFMVVVAHEFSHFYLDLKDPTAKNPYGGVLAFENRVRSQLNLPARNSYDFRTDAKVKTMSELLEKDKSALIIWDRTHGRDGRRLTLTIPPKAQTTERSQEEIREIEAKNRAMQIIALQSRGRDISKHVAEFEKKFTGTKAAKALGKVSGRSGAVEDRLKEFNREWDALK